MLGLFAVALFDETTTIEQVEEYCNRYKYNEEPMRFARMVGYVFDKIRRSQHA